MATSAADLDTSPTNPSAFPTREAIRLSVLRRLGLLDTPPSESFDRVTRLAARTLDVPIVLVSLVDETRQWFKSRFGLDVLQTPREVSLCTHAVLARKPLIVTDTLLDSRFAASPLVTGAPFIRAYAGIPIFTRLGHAIGTLCAIDHVPRQFDPADIQALGDFAKVIEDQIHAQELAANAESVLQFATDREKLFRDTFELAAVGMVHVSLSGMLLRANRCTCEMLGFQAGELDLLSVIDLTHPDDIGRATVSFRRLSSGAVDAYHIEKRLQRKDQRYIWCHLSVALKRQAMGEPEYLIAVIEDITARRQADADMLLAQDSLQTEVAQQTERLRESNEALKSHIKNLLESELSVRHMEHRLRSITNNVPALIGYFNRELRCEFANEAYRGFFGKAPDRIIGMKLSDLLTPQLYLNAEPMCRLALEGFAQRFEEHFVKHDGSESVLDVRYIPDFDQSTSVRGYFVLITDQTTSHRVQASLEAANARLSNDSSADFLTGLVNRKTFDLHNDEAMTRYKKNGDVYAVILLDLDDFKHINDSLGHDVGDEALRSVGKLLKLQLRSHRDVAARLGGEEFAMLCFGALDEELLVQVADRIRLQIGKAVIEGAGGILQFTGSFGLAICAENDIDSKSVYARAHAALADAKSAGGNCVKFRKLHDGTAAHPVR